MGKMCLWFKGPPKGITFLRVPIVTHTRISCSQVGFYLLHELKYAGLRCMFWVNDYACLHAGVKMRLPETFTKHCRDGALKFLAARLGRTAHVQDVQGYQV